MKKAFDKVADWLDTMPLWVILLGMVGLLAFVVMDFRVPDPLPFLEEILVTGIIGWTGWYAWRRIFGGPRTPGAREVRERMREIERLAAGLQKTAKKSSSIEVRVQVTRMSELLPRARDVAQRLLALEVILTRPEYKLETAEGAVAKLEAKVAETAGAGHEEFEAALGDARAHAGNLTAVREKSAAMRASLERVRQLYRRAESDIVLGTLETDTAARAVKETADELLDVLEDLDRAREEVATAAREVGAAVEEGKSNVQKAAAQQKTGG